MTISKVKQAASWNSAASIVREAINIAYMIALMRRLHPDAFGLIGMCAIFIGFGSVVTKGGVRPALVHERDPGQLVYSSFFWILLGLGVTLTTVSQFLAVSLADFFDAPPLTELFQLTSSLFLLRALTIVPSAILRRRLDFQSIGLANIIASFIGGLTAVILAYNDFGVYSLAAQLIVQELILAVLISFYANWTPDLRFSVSSLSDAFNYASGLLTFDIVNYWSRTIDDLLVGRSLGDASLGVYNRAYKIMLMPVRHLSAAISEAVYPSLSSLRDDSRSARQQYLQMLRVILLLVTPAMLGLSLLADHIVLFAFGPSWSEMIRPLRILAIAAIFRSIATTGGTLYKTTGETNEMARWGLFESVLLLLLFLAGIRWGVTGVATAFLIHSFLTFAPTVLLPGRYISMTYDNLLHAMVYPFSASTVMAVSISGADFLLSQYTSHHLTLLVANTLVGLLTYFLLTATFRPEAYSYLYKTITTLAGSEHSR